MMLVALLVPAAAAGAPTAQEQPAKVDPSITDGSAQRALDAARERWRAAAVRSYSVGVRRSCFCPQTKVVRVVVRGGVLARSTPEDVRAFATVPRQFALVQKAIDGRYAALSARYGSRGNPVAINLDPVAMVADEETYYTFSGLRPR